MAEKDADARLYAEFLDGDQRALEQLVTLHGDALTRFSYCITWLYTVARNRAIDYVRRRGRERSVTGLENVLLGEDAEEGVFTSLRREKLYVFMQQLPARYKEVLFLNYFDGFSVDEICHILKKGAKQVYNLLARARSALKEILEKEGYSYENF